MMFSAIQETRSEFYSQEEMVLEITCRLAFGDSSHAESAEIIPPQARVEDGMRRERAEIKASISLFREHTRPSLSRHPSIAPNHFKPLCGLSLCSPPLCMHLMMRQGV